MYFILHQHPLALDDFCSRLLSSRKETTEFLNFSNFPKFSDHQLEHKSWSFSHLIYFFYWQKIIKKINLKTV